MKGYQAMVKEVGLMPIDSLSRHVAVACPLQTKILPGSSRGWAILFPPIHSQ